MSREYQNLIRIKDGEQYVLYLPFENGVEDDVIENRIYQKARRLIRQTVERTPSSQYLLKVDRGSNGVYAVIIKEPRYDLEDL